MHSLFYICILNALLPYFHLSFCHTRKIIQHTVFIFIFTLCTQKNTYLPSTVQKNSPWSEPVIISSRPTKYNTRHKSLKREPFVLNFFQISYSHSSHLCSHSNAPPLLSQCWPERILEHWNDCKPKSTLGAENHTSVSRFVRRIAAFLCH